MSAPTVTASEMHAPVEEPKNYLNAEHTVKSWLLTGDHKRIAIMYLISTSLFFLVGGIFASLIRLELVSPSGVLLETETYNKIFGMFFLVMIVLSAIGLRPATRGTRWMAFAHCHPNSYAKVW